jgi:hypothetical protein
VLGVVTASIGVSAIGQFLFLWPLSLRMLDLSLRDFAMGTLLPGWLPAVIAGGVTFGMGALIPAVTWISVFFDIGVGLVAYVATMYVMATAEDRRDIGRVLRRLRNPWRGRGSDVEPAGSDERAPS